MRPILSIAACALMLAGCADVHDKLAGAPACSRLAGADHAIAVQGFGLGVRMGDGSVIPGRNLRSSGKLETDWGNSPGCIRDEHNETKPPKHYDLHKIGMAV